MANRYRYRTGLVEVDVVRKSTNEAFDVGDFVVLSSTSVAQHMEAATDNLAFLGICNNYAATADTKVTFNRANGHSIYEYPFGATTRTVRYGMGVTWARKQVLSANHTPGSDMTDSIACVTEVRSADTVVTSKAIGAGTGTMANPAPTYKGAMVRFKATVKYTIGDRS